MNTSKDYYDKLGELESSNRYNIQNEKGYLGKYQMGEPALVDSGYYTRKQNYGDYKNQWDMPFTGKMGVKTKNDYLNNKEAQEDAVRKYHGYLWEATKKIAKENHGKIINGVKMTYSGMLAGAFLVGQGGLESFIEGFESNRLGNPERYPYNGKWTDKLNLDIGNPDTDNGHWITLENGKHLFIKDKV